MSIFIYMDSGLGAWNCVWAYSYMVYTFGNEHILGVV